ncbi:MAG TPA: chemotaxis-specific protein-glutamate methyltransferase CheB [Chthoniobacter sp.]|nr:chemotaxis-specific protein-glutamate methyltransferase CheB [Chthoniobacter sp.]
MTDGKIKVLVVDDSKVARMLMAHVLGADPQIEVVGTLNDGQEALDFVQNQKPDVVVMDIHMPNLDGFEATRRIMETQPVPIIICTATANASEVVNSFRLMEAGAVACVEKPVSPGSPDFDKVVGNLLQTIKLMSEVKVVRRWPRARSAKLAGKESPEPEWKPAATGIHIVGIGASTGGPPVLQTILASLPKDFPAPVLIVQHIARGFLPGLLDWLRQTTGWQVHIAAHGIVPLPGHAYLAPDDYHMGVTASQRILLSREEPMANLRPAVAFLFRSLAGTYGSHAVGVLLTGMGRDGATELKLMRDAGAETIAQDRESSVVHGMPGEAIAAGGATYILPADKIADTLITLVRRPASIAGPPL